MNRYLKASALAVLLSGTVIGLAGFGFGHFGCHGQKFMKRIADAHVEEVMDKINATPEQRQKVSAMEDKLIGDFKAIRTAHRASLAKVADAFGQDPLDTQVLDAARAQNQQSIEQLQGDIRQTLQDLHEALTPAQRQQLASLVKEHLARSDCGE